MVLSNGRSPDPIIIFGPALAYWYFADKLPLPVWLGVPIALGLGLWLSAVSDTPPQRLTDAESEAHEHQQGQKDAT
jgi:hypothetical protein